MGDTRGGFDNVIFESDVADSRLCSSREKSQRQPGKRSGPGSIPEPADEIGGATELDQRIAGDAAFESKDTVITTFHRCPEPWTKIKMAAAWIQADGVGQVNVADSI